MKKSLLILGLALALFSCKEDTQKESFKTAYIDTTVLMDKYEKFKDEDEKFKVKSQELGRPLEAKLKAFQSEASSFRQNAQIKGMAWAQQKGAELQQREQQLAIEREELYRQIQLESDSIRAGLVKDMKEFIKAYGKKKGFDYIYGTGDVATVLYAKDSYDITEAVLKELNDEFSSSKGDNKAKTEATKEEEKK